LANSVAYQSPKITFATIVDTVEFIRQSVRLTEVIIRAPRPIIRAAAEIEMTANFASFSECRRR
jgi:hypothetical protein